MTGSSDESSRGKVAHRMAFDVAPPPAVATATVAKLEPQNLALQWPRPGSLDQPVVSDVCASGDRLPIGVGTMRASLEAALGAASPQSPIRVHIESPTGDGVHVWLGVDASAMTDIASLVATVARWCARSGVRLARIVCNGTSHTPPLADSASVRVATGDDVHTGVRGSLDLFVRET